MRLMRLTNTCRKSARFLTTSALGTGLRMFPGWLSDVYPRIRIARDRLTNLYFDLWMDCDEKGQRFEQFRRDLPYSLYAGASIIEADGSKHGIRCQIDITCFSGKPFDQVGAVLQSEMEKHLPTLEAWDAQYLKENGKKVKLGT